MSWSYIAGSLKQMTRREKEGRGPAADDDRTALDGRLRPLAEQDLHLKGTTTERATMDATAEPLAT